MYRLLLSATLAAVLFGAAASAQEIRDIETEVHLLQNGDARVVQQWDISVTEGTEWYIPVANPGKSHISNLQVSENGVAFKSDGDAWDSSRSLTQKAGRCGIVRKSDGDCELCWGLGALGDHVFTISYTIENLVLDYGECDGFHWHFLNDEWTVEPEHVSIGLVNDTGGPAWYWNADDDCNVRFWGFGMAGESALQDGVIYFESTEAFGYGSFFSALVQFDKGLFQPQEQGEGSFEELKEEAFSGSDYEDDFGEGFFYLLVLLFLGIPLLRAAYVLLRRVYWRVSGNRYDKNIFGQTKIASWWRDVPLGGNPTALFSILQKGDKLSEEARFLFPNLVSAYFLKWIQEGLVRVEKDPKNDRRMNLLFVRGMEEIAFEDQMEGTVYAAAREAAGENLLLEANEFRKWSRKHEKIVTAWPVKAVESGKALWGKYSQQDRCHAVEFMNFLNDYTLVGEREAPEVGLWKQYMVLAAALGIAEKVARNFEKLFPHKMEEYARQSNMTSTYTTYAILREVSRSSTAMMDAAVSRASARSIAGGGGSISIGGGFGGFGGGHGGGAR